MTTLSTHVLDTSRGRPASGVAVRLDRRQADGGWSRLGAGVTDADGRAADLLAGGVLEPGDYRLTFATGDYFAAAGIECFFPRAVIEFRVADDRHHHVPLLLSPFGYSTYRGS